MSRRFVVNAVWRTADGRSYSPGPVTLANRDDAIRLYRRMRDNPYTFVGDDCVLLIVGPVVEEEKVGRTWRYRGTPAAAFPAIDKLEDWTPTVTEYDEPQQGDLLEPEEVPL